MRHRFYNRVFAKLNGYFWLPCPLCNQKFGGHESSMDEFWRTGRTNFWTEKDTYVAKIICPDCTAAGKGSKLKIRGIDRLATE